MQLGPRKRLEHAEPKQVLFRGFHILGGRPWFVRLYTKDDVALWARKGIGVIPI